MFINGCAAEVVSIGEGGTAVVTPCSGDGDNFAVSPGV